MTNKTDLTAVLYVLREIANALWQIVAILREIRKDLRSRRLPPVIHVYMFTWAPCFLQGAHV